VQTDNAPYWAYLQATLPHFFEITKQPDPWPDAPRGRTRREIIALRRGMAVYRGYGTVRPLDAAQLSRLAWELPSPDFDAGPRARDLDELEGGRG
jgi:tRNA (guanine-N7-)-methyltransferase